jgi:hypothetical protein
VPKIRETPDAFIVEPTFGEQLAQTLPALVSSITAAMRQKREDEAKRAELKMAFDNATPEEQMRMKSNPDFVKALDGRLNIQKWLHKGKAPDLPIRDLTPEELLARQKLRTDEKLNAQALTQNDLSIQSLQRRASVEKIQLAAFQSIWQSQQEAGVTGLKQPGNIDLFMQPIVPNADGTSSTVDSSSFNIDGQEILLPSVTPDGRHLTDENDIVAEYKKTGRHLGKFDSPDNATAYAKQLHEDYAAGKYDPKNRLNPELVPKNMRTLLTYAVAFPEKSMAEVSQLYLEGVDGPEMGHQIALAHFGLDQVTKNKRATEAYQWITEQYGYAPPGALEAATALGNGDLDAISHLPIGMKTLALQKYELDQKQYQFAVNDAARRGREFIAGLGDNILQKNPGMTIPMAQDIALRMAQGKELTAEQQKFSVGAAGARQAMLDMTASKTAAELNEARSGIGPIFKLMQEQRAIVESENSSDLAKDRAKKSVEELQKEVTMRVGKLVGITVNFDEKGEGGGFLGATVKAMWEFMNEAAQGTGKPKAGGEEWKSPGAALFGGAWDAAKITGSAVTQAAARLAVKIGPPLSGGLEGVGRGKKTLEGAITASLTTPERPKTDYTTVVEAPKLTDDQKVALHNTADELATQLADPSTSLEQKQHIMATFDVIERIYDGRLDYAELLKEVPQEKTPAAPKAEYGRQY